jgi:serine phosphatase RsbU (regulator of sigma subunit)
VVLLDGGQVGITIGDVGGHGSEAAAVMGRLRTALAAIAPDEPDPGRVLAKVNRMLCRIAAQAAHDPTTGVARSADSGTLLTTALYGRLDPTARRFTYAVAGHPGPVIIDAATATAWLDDPPPNLPLGLDPGADYTPRRVPLPAQGKLLVCTDGVYERRGTSITDSLTALVANAARLASHHVDDIADALLAAAPPAPPQWSDDLALVIVDWSPDGAGS